MDHEYFIKKETIEEVKKFLSFKNPNNFDEYHAMVLPRTSINESVLFSNNKSTSIKINCRKNPNPQKININDVKENFNQIDNSDEEINKQILRIKNINIPEKSKFISANNFNKKKKNSSKSIKIKNGNDLNRGYEINSKNSKTLENQISFPLKSVNENKIGEKLIAKKSTKLNQKEIEDLLEIKKSNLIIDNLKSSNHILNKHNLIFSNNDRDEKENHLYENKNNFFHEKIKMKDNKIHILNNQLKDKSLNNSFSKDGDINEKNLKLEEELSEKYSSKKKRKIDSSSRNMDNLHLFENYENNNYFDNHQDQDLFSLKTFSNNLISKKRERCENEYDRSKQSINTKNHFDCLKNNVKNKLNSKENLIDLNTDEQNEIEEETKDNSNNNEIGNNYSKFSKKYISNINDLENINKLNNSNYKAFKNTDFCYEEKMYFKNFDKNITNNYENFNKILENKYVNNNSFNTSKNKKKNQSNKSINIISEYNTKVPKKSYKKLTKNEDYEYENDSNINCILCGWKYPKEMDLKDKNEHLNECMDGKGEQHKKAWASSQRLIKIAINQEEERNIIGENSMIKMRSAKDNLGNYCSLCEKKISFRNGKTMSDHILECYKEKEEEMFKKSQKK